MPIVPLLLQTTYDDTVDGLVFQHSFIIIATVSSILKRCRRNIRHREPLIACGQQCLKLTPMSVGSVESAHLFLNSISDRSRKTGLSTAVHAIDHF